MSHHQLPSYNNHGSIIDHNHQHVNMSTDSNPHHDTEWTIVQVVQTRELVRAMAPVDYVLDYIDLSQEVTDCHERQLKFEDSFARIIDACWNEYGPSERYLRRLVNQYVIRVENRGAVIASDALSELVLRSSLCKESVPESNESCYLSFRLLWRIPLRETKCEEEKDWLRIRVFPFHNDVALRLWEAGAALAEYCLDHFAIMEGKHIIELGAGVGLTGLVIGAHCHPASIHLTDYTDVCRANLEHNIQVNRDWLLRNNFSPDRISQVGCACSIVCIVHATCENLYNL